MPQIHELDPILVKEVEEIITNIQRLELENQELQLKLDQTTKENKYLKWESQQKEKPLKESNKRVRSEKGKREWIGDAFHGDDFELKAINQELHKVKHSIDEL